jgi:hypothetical protein
MRACPRPCHRGWSLRAASHQQQQQTLGQCWTLLRFQATKRSAPAPHTTQSLGLMCQLQAVRLVQTSVLLARARHRALGGCTVPVQLAAEAGPNTTCAWWCAAAAALTADACISIVRTAVAGYAQVVRVDRCAAPRCSKGWLNFIDCWCVRGVCEGGGTSHLITSWLAARSC